MNNSQAAHLRPGARVRRKEPFETRSTATRREIYIVERVERPVERNGDWTVHAGGFTFKAWEIERVRYEE
jgi:N-dimethylarginine dimethylaminohydrolase